MSNFFQTPPNFSHPYKSDFLLKSCIDHFCLDEEKKQAIHRDLSAFAERLLSEVEELGLRAENDPPIHRPYDAWGKRVDEIIVNEAWMKLDKVAAEEGLIALGYERDKKGGHRLHQFAKLYLFHPSSAFYSCPLAMTDGATKLIESLRQSIGPKDLLDKAYGHLTSKVPGEFWTSGQWMTERTGGSDVGQSETIARKDESGQWRLYGTKWFTSATTSQMAMTLARIEDESGQSIDGSRGLSLFYLELRDEAGSLQNIQVNRLKDKLGTKALPTAELDLNGTPALLLGEPGRGVAQIATLFNVTRIYNACCTLGAFRRLYSLAYDYSLKRKAFGKRLIDQPLHKKNLMQLKAKLDGSMSFLFYLISVFDAAETSYEREGDYDERLMKKVRLLTPIAKLFTAKVNMIATSELVESFGGAGYVEDTGIPRWLRDAQTLTIWEGTTNVLSLDTLRAITKENALEILIENMQLKLSKFKNVDLSCLNYAQEQLTKLKGVSAQLFEKSKSSPELLELSARELSFSIAQVVQGISLLELIDSSKIKEEYKAEMKQSYSILCQKSWVENFVDI